ncbi:hypothetical protein diail_9594, partial [Diaporthe ilicicola]
LVRAVNVAIADKVSPVLSHLYYRLANVCESVALICLQIPLRGRYHPDQVLDPAALHTHLRSLRLEVRTLLWMAAFFVVAYPLTFVIGMANCCKPVSFYWSQFSGNMDGHCRLNTGLFFVVMAIINLFIDFFILVLPIPSILRLQMSWRKKAGVCGIMLPVLGGLSEIDIFVKALPNFAAPA